MPQPSWGQRGGAVVRRLMADLGLTAEQAAGIVGNLGFESGGFNSLHEIGQPEGRGGYGWAQWTADRRVAFMDWCKAHNLAWTSDEANYGYLLAELHTTQAKSLEQVKKTTTVEAAVFTFGYWFERPGGTTEDHLPGYDGRLKYAKDALAGIAPEPPKPAPVGKPPVKVERAVKAFNKSAARLQTVLQEIGFYTGKVDGDWGPLSRKALLAYVAKFRDG